MIRCRRLIPATLHCLRPTIVRHRRITPELECVPIRSLSCDSKSSLLKTIRNGHDLYLHVGPSGDFWTGQFLFAAKHLQPDYVKSIRLDETMDVEALLELLEEDGREWTRVIYDKGDFPQDFLDKLKEEEAASKPL